MKSLTSYFQLLNFLAENKLSKIETNQLVEKIYSFTFFYLRYKNRNLYKVFVAENITLQEMAIDAIAPLFERDGNGRFIKIIKSFNSWEPKINSEEKALFFLNKLAAKSAEKYISELLRNSDPFFSSILDSVNYLITKNNFTKKQILGTTYIVESQDFIKLGSLPDTEFINQLPIEIFDDNSSLLLKLFNFLKENTDKSPAIPLNALVQKLKKIRLSNCYNSEATSFENIPEIESLTQIAYNNTIKKLKETYTEKNKINDFETEAFTNALSNILIDMKNGGISNGLHNYLLDQLPQSNFNDYKNKYQNTFEYLFKFLKNEIKIRLDK
ncbi:MAG: hypothetical protein IPM32_14290 [Ignavibacteriae bacterium]|nr:hypothetical protein [Ignavibacteriota bacterium]